MDDRRYQYGSRRGGGFKRAAPASVLTVAALTLAACGGGSGGGGEPAVPADMRVYTALALTELMGALDLSYSPTGLSCPDGGSSSTEVFTTGGPYGDVNGETLRFNDCRTAGLVLNGEFAGAESAGEVVYLRGGSPGGENPFTQHMEIPGVTLEMSGEQYICPNCGGGTNPTARTTALNLSTVSSTRATFSMGTADEPLLDWNWPDQPAAGQVTYRLGGWLDYRIEGGCRVGPARYETPNDGRLLVYDMRGRVFESGLLRITTAAGDQADVAFSPSEATITTDGVSESYGYEALVDAYNDYCDLSWPVPGVLGGPGIPTPVGVL